MRRILGVIYAIMILSGGSAYAKLTEVSGTVSYTVQSGDTLYSIAHAHHTTIKELLEVNRLERNAVIKVGQTLNVPQNTYFPQKRSTDETPATQSVESSSADKLVDYTVQSGDTFYTIARKHHTSIRELLEANQMDRNTVIKVGQHLRVPTDTYPPKATLARKTLPKTPRKANVRTSTVATEGKGIYVVKSGDTLFSIARKNHILLGKLMKLNNIGLGTPLHAGQVLRVSGQQSYVADVVPTTKPAAPKKLPVGAMPSYTVKKGDTLWGIARDHHLTLAQIRKLNKMKKTDRIHTGMVLAVGKPIQAPRKTYTVKKGDTLWLIAKKHGMTTQELRKLNGLQRKDTIHTGMVLALKKGVKLPAKVQPSREKQIVARLKKKGAKKEDIAAVMARIKKSKKKNPDIEAILAQVQKKKRKPKPVQTPLRVAKKKSKTRKGNRYDSAMALLNNRRGSSRASRSNDRVIRIAKRYLGRRYVWGAVGPSTFDCSGFTQYVMRKAKGVRLPRVSRKQAYYGKYVSRSHLKPGDLIFFDTSRRRRGYVNHVGIYIGNNKFIHASSGKHRVVITSLNRPFYRSRFKWGRRVN